MSPRLMIVDDALVMRAKIRQVAEAAGWTVVAEAGDGAEAVTLYKEHTPDLVTMDMVMPEVDGLAALQSIRADDPNARVVMISAVSQREMLKRCIQSGAEDFIVKPFDPTSLGEYFATGVSQ